MNKLVLIALPLVLSLLVSAGFAVSTSYAQGNQTGATAGGNETGGNQTGNQSGGNQSGGGPLGQLGEALGGLMGGGQ